MKNIEKILAQAAGHLPQPSIEEVMKADAPKMSEHDDITQQIYKDVVHKKPVRMFAYMATACAMIAILLVGFAFHTSPLAVCSIVELDINPGIELRLDKEDKVLQIAGINDEAKALLEQVSFEDQSLNTTLTTLTELLVYDGYFPQGHGAVILSVSDKNDERAKYLGEKVTTELETILKQNGIHANIMTQDMKSNRKLSKSAQKHGITMGHLSVIEHIMAVDPTATMEQLLALSSQELIDMIDDMDIAVQDGHFKLYIEEDDEDEDDDEEKPASTPNANMHRVSVPTATHNSSIKPTPSAPHNPKNTAGASSKPIDDDTDSDDTNSDDDYDDDIKNNDDSDDSPKPTTSAVPEEKEDSDSDENGSTDDTDSTENNSTNDTDSTQTTNNNTDDTNSSDVYIIGENGGTKQENDEVETELDEKSGT
ncbi:MAG: hypothetical protein RSA64_01935 [Christensenellaceae bacterium]